MNAPREFSYPGKELDLFALATNWKAYVKREIGKYLVGHVLEIGAGVGGTTVALNDGSAERWLCLEPDSDQAERLQSRVRRNGDNQAPIVIASSLAAFAEKPVRLCALFIEMYSSTLTTTD